MFCSSSITVHLLRGLGAAALLGLAVFFAADEGASIAVRLAAAPLIVGVFFLLRGCPMCWLIGLFETVAKRRATRPEN